MAGPEAVSRVIRRTGEEERVVAAACTADHSIPATFATVELFIVVDWR
jgi:hypothetical protein